MLKLVSLIDARKNFYFQNENIDFYNFYARNEKKNYTMIVKTANEKSFFFLHLKGTTPAILTSMFKIKNDFFIDRF